MLDYLPGACISFPGVYIQKINEGEMRRKKEVFVYLSLLFFFLTIVVFSCRDGKTKNIQKSISAMDIIKGKALAAKYCQSCHLLPEPAWQYFAARAFPFII